MSITLEWDNRQDAFAVNDALIEKLEQLLRLVGEMEQIDDGEVALSFVDDETIHELNKQYRGIDRPTDVLSFAMHESGEDEPEIFFDEEDMEEVDGEMDGEGENDFPDPLGDIVISIPRAIAQSQEYGHSVEREIGFLFVHGFLHLLGYDHEDEQAEQEMFAKQELVLQKAGLLR